VSTIDLKRKPGETENAYVQRLGSYKDNGLITQTWDQLKDIFNKYCRSDGEAYGESTYRKKYADIKRFQQEGIAEDADELVELRRELEKEKVKVRDERNEYRKLIREEARKESYKEQFLSSIEEAAGKFALQYNYKLPTISSDNDMIIALTDIHAGLEIHNFWNDFDGDVLKYRMQHYLDRIFEIQERHKSQDAYVVIQEVLSGAIHPTTRIENNQDLIDQFLMVVDYICDFLDALSRKFRHVNVYVAPGNHSRIHAKKDESLAHENFDNLVIPFLRGKMQNYPNIHCYTNDIEQSMAIFPVRGINVASVHGDKDSFATVADRLNKLLRTRIDCIITGHKHTFAVNTSADVTVIQSGCLCGTDSFALDNRLRNKPEQAVCIVSEAEGLDCIYNVKFD